jgi:hypothetical protein
MSKRERFYELAGRPLRKATVTVCGEEFAIRELSEADAASMEVAMQVSGKYEFERHRRTLVAFCLLDDDGKRIVDNPEDLAGMAKTIIGKIYEKCLEINSYQDEDIEALAKKSNAVEG